MIPAKGALHCSETFSSDVGFSRQLSVVTVNSRHSIENEMPWARYVNSRGCVDPNLHTTNDGQRITSEDFWFTGPFYSFPHPSSES